MFEPCRQKRLTFCRILLTPARFSAGMKRVLKLPALSRPECREGLAKLKAEGELLLPHDMYKSSKDIERLSAAMRKSKSAWD
jgi:hypothetical protein